MVAAAPLWSWRSTASPRCRIRRPRTRPEGHVAARRRPRHAEHDEADQLHDLHHRVDPRLYPAHLLLLVRERLSERPAGAERGIHDDARSVGGSRDAAGDARALQFVSIRGVLLLGLASWTLRYLLLAYGNADAGIWMFYLASCTGTATTSSSWPASSTPTRKRRLTCEAVRRGSSRS